MSLTEYEAVYQHKEYERRIRAGLVKHALQEGRAARSRTVAQLAGKGTRQIARLAALAWRWGHTYLSLLREPGPVVVEQWDYADDSAYLEVLVTSKWWRNVLES